MVKPSPYNFSKSNYAADFFVGAFATEVFLYQVSFNINSSL